jgi:hypothetical protein
MNNACLVTEFFQWAADCGRIHVAHTTTQQITIRFPDYDAPEDPEQDYELVFPITTFESAAHFEVAPTDDPHVVTVPLLITDHIVAEIPLVHLPANYVPTGAYLNIQHLPIPCSQITEL